MPESARGKHATPGQAVFEGSWVVISGVISPLIWVIIMVTLLITLLITTHKPPRDIEATAMSVEVQS